MGWQRRDEHALARESPLKITTEHAAFGQRPTEAAPFFRALCERVGRSAVRSAGFDPVPDLCKTLVKPPPPLIFTQLPDYNPNINFQIMAQSPLPI